MLSYGLSAALSKVIFVVYYKYRPGWVNDLCDLKNFKERIDYIRLISDKRKQFLKERYPYWVDYARTKDKGLIHSSDAE